MRFLSVGSGFLRWVWVYVLGQGFVGGVFFLLGQGFMCWVRIFEVGLGLCWVRVFVVGVLC